MKNYYADVPEYSSDETHAAIERNEPDELRVMIVGLALYAEDFDLVDRLCCELSRHEHEEVRGNAVLGFGHLARRFGSLNADKVRPIIERALIDSSEYVTGQAWSAAEDVEHFLGWKIEGYSA